MHLSRPSFLPVLILFITLTHTAQSSSQPPSSPTFLLPQPIGLHPQDPPGVALLQIAVCSNGSVLVSDVLPGGVDFTPTEGIAGVQGDSSAFSFYLRNVSRLIFFRIVSNGPLFAEGSLVVRCRDPASGDESTPVSSNFSVLYEWPLLREDPSNFPISISTAVPIGRSIFQFNFEPPSPISPTVNVSVKHTNQCHLSPE